MASKLQAGDSAEVEAVAGAATTAEAGTGSASGGGSAAAPEPAAVAAPAAPTTTSANGATAARPTVAEAKPTVASTPVPTPASTAPMKSDIDAIDLLDTAGPPVLKRLAPVVGGVVALVLVILLIRRIRSS